MWKDGCSNSLKFTVGGQVRIISSDTYKRWHSLTAKLPVKLKKGYNKAVVFNIEPGISLDYFSFNPE